MKLDKNELKSLMPIVFAVPVFGALCLLVRLAGEKGRWIGTRTIGLEQGSVMTGQYMQIQVKEDGCKELVPLEEELLVNDNKV